MNATLTEQSGAKLFVLKTVLADLLQKVQSQINEDSTFDELFSGDLDAIRRVWEAIPELTERHLRVSREWTLSSLAQEWEKTVHAHC